MVIVVTRNEKGNKKNGFVPNLLIFTILIFYSNCANYDLCEECEAIHGVHDSDHVFLKLRKPARLGKRTVILKNTLYKVKQALDPNKNDDQNDLNRPSNMPGPLEDFIKTKMERLVI